MRSVSTLWSGLLLGTLIVLSLLVGYGLTGTPGGGLILGLATALALYGHWRWAASRPAIPWHMARPGRRRRGFSLVSALTALAMLTIIMSICVQVMFTAARARQVGAARARALAAAVSAIESARAGMVLAPARLPVPGATVRLRWAPGPTAGTSTLSAEAVVDGQRVALATVVPGRPRPSVTLGSPSAGHAVGAGRSGRATKSLAQGGRQ